MRRLSGAIVSCLVLTACGGGGGGGTPASSQTLYVRTTGSDANSGSAPERALQSLVGAVQKLHPGVTVYVGPGRYKGMVDIAGIESSGGAPLQLIADRTGEHTGDAPGDVVLDADGDFFALRVSKSPFVIIDGFTITGAEPVGNTSATAVQIRSNTHDAVIRNCVINNDGPGDGIRLQDSVDVLIFNNLIVDNNRGILVSGKALNARIVNNTIAASRSTGITLKEGSAGAPTGATLRNNIIQDSKNNVSISVGNGPPSSLTGYSGNFNLVFVTDLTDQTKSYRPANIQGASDLNEDAKFVNSDGGDFHLADTSPAVNAGTGAIDTDLRDQLLQGSTSADGTADTPPLDMGYHYPAAP